MAYADIEEIEGNKCEPSPHRTYRVKHLGEIRGELPRDGELDDGPKEDKRDMELRRLKVIPFIYMPLAVLLLNALFCSVIVLYLATEYVMDSFIDTWTRKALLAWVMSWKLNL